MDERAMGDFLTYKLYLTKWDDGHVRVSSADWPKSRQTGRVSLPSHTRFVYPLQVRHINVHSDKDVDVVTGLKQKIHYGRPPWDKEFEQVRKENPT